MLGVLRGVCVHGYACMHACFHMCVSKEKGEYFKNQCVMGICVFANCTGNIMHNSDHCCVSTVSPKIIGW